MTKMGYGVVYLLALAASCATIDDRPAIAVTEPNDLGVTRLETTRVVDRGNDVFTLRAFSADDQERASVQLTTGVIPELTTWLPGGRNNIGSDILVRVAASESHMVTRETQRFELGVFDDPTITKFLALATVSSTLAREVNVLVAPVSASAEDAYIIYEDSWSATTCPASILNTSPVALQCCYLDNEYLSYSAPNAFHTYFVLADNSTVQRTGNPKNATGGRSLGAPFVPCKGSDGVSACSGAACTYGPNGFTRPIKVLPSGSFPYGYVSKSTSPPSPGTGTTCAATHVASPPTPIFGNVTGTFATQQGCPGSDGGGGNGDWDW